MLDTQALHDERNGDSSQAGHLVEREAEAGRIGAFLAAGRTDGGALLVTGEPGVGKTELLNAAFAAASVEPQWMEGTGGS